MQTTLHRYKKTGMCLMLKRDVAKNRIRGQCTELQIFTYPGYNLYVYSNLLTCRHCGCAYIYYGNIMPYVYCTYISIAVYNLLSLLYYIVLL